ncbi:MAG TPA: hypothetical protein VI456_15365 [Polyangia bacterium]
MPHKDGRLRLAVGLLAAASTAIACHRAPPPVPARAPSPPHASPAALALPEVVGFEAGPQVEGSAYVRRQYRRGRARIEVTLARMAMPPEAYADWVGASTASFPQAALDLPAGAANGFYQCSDGTNPSCDLLIQLRAGFHLELRGSGTSRRDDVDALARGLPLRALAHAESID